jgi:hypothetical protein
MTRKPITVVLAATLAIAITACGTNKPSSAGASVHPSFLSYSECMRTHGVPDFPDPAAGGGIQISDNSGTIPQAPAFQSADRSCRKLLPGGGPGAQHASAATRAAMLRTSECMRRRGIPGFPDPTSALPSNPAAYSLVDDRGGVVLAIPARINPQSAAFRHALTACGGQL